MTMTITDAFDLPRPEDIRAMGFVIKLREAEPGSDEVKQLVKDYVITPAVQNEIESGPHCQDHFSGAISLGSAGLFLGAGAAEAAPAIPALEPALGSHSCGALSSAQVPPL